MKFKMVSCLICVRTFVLSIDENICLLEFVDGGFDDKLNIIEIWPSSGLRMDSIQVCDYRRHVFIPITTLELRPYSHEIFWSLDSSLLAVAIHACKANLCIGRLDGAKVLVNH